MGCERLYRLWNSHLARKGIIQFAVLVLISQVEWAYLPVAGYLRQMDSRAAELSLTERAIAMESAYYYYGAYVMADSEAVGVKDAGTQAAKTEESKTDAGVAGAEESETEATKTEVGAAGVVESETEADKTEVGAAGTVITETEGAETEDAGGSELTELAELADSEAEGVQDAQTEALEEMRIQIVDSDEQGTPAGIQIQPEIQEGMLKEQNRSGNKSTEIPQEEYFKQMLRENGIEDVDNNLAESESGQNEETGQGEEENDGFSQGASSSGFELASVPAYTYDWTKQWTQDDLRSEFFAVDGSTSMKEEYLNAERLLNEDLMDVILCGNVDEVNGVAKENGLDVSKATILDPLTYPEMDEMVKTMVELRKGKMSEEECRTLLTKCNYFGTMLVKMGVADCLLGGATYSTADTVRPALQLIKTKPGNKIVSSCFILVRPAATGDNEVLAMGDCAINIHPTEDELVEIAKSLDMYVQG